jgi:hypothetical protein
MKLPDGMKIYVGSKKFVGEIPDNMAPKGLQKKLDAKKSDVKPVKENKAK